MIKNNYFEEFAQNGFPANPTPEHTVDTTGLRPEHVFSLEDARLCDDFLQYMICRGAPGADTIQTEDGGFSIQGYFIGFGRDLRRLASFSPEVSYGKTTYRRLSRSESKFIINDHRGNTNLFPRIYLCLDGALREEGCWTVPETGYQIEPTLTPVSEPYNYQISVPNVGSHDATGTTHKWTPGVRIICNTAPICAVLENLVRINS